MTENSPIVMTLNGKVSTEKIGFTKTKSKESATPPRISVNAPPTIFTPPTK